MLLSQPDCLTLPAASLPHRLLGAEEAGGSEAGAEVEAEAGAEAGAEAEAEVVEAEVEDTV